MVLRTKKHVQLQKHERETERQENKGITSGWSSRSFARTYTDRTQAFLGVESFAWGKKHELPCYVVMLSYGVKRIIQYTRDKQSE